MSEEEQSRIDIIQQGAENMRKLNLLSDTFASVALQDIDACQYVVRKILGRNDIRIITVKSRYHLLTLTAKKRNFECLRAGQYGAPGQH